MTKWAILIGIDSYLSTADAKLPLLSGCVNDVKKMKEVLHRKWGFHVENIIMLVSEHRESQSTENPAENDRGLEPSYQNLIKVINLVTGQSKPGDVVYLHFSGYTQIVPTVLPQTRKFLHENEDLALLPSNLLQDGTCLHDVELAALLRRLVANGVEVAAAIDGRGMLDDVGKRVSLQTSSLSVPQAEVLLASHGSWSKFPQHSWLQNPPPEASYALFALGGYFNKGGGREYSGPDMPEPCGFLTYWLLKLLEEENEHVTYRTISRRILLETKPWLLAHTFLFIHEQKLLMTGNMERVFLGENQYPIPLLPAYPAALTHDDGGLLLRIEGGTAHGLKPEEYFAITKGHKFRRLSEIPPTASLYGVFKTLLVYGLFSLARPVMTTSTIDLPFQENELLMAIRNFDGSGIGPEPPRTSRTLSSQKDQQGALSMPMKNISDLQPLSLELQAELYRSLLGVATKSMEASKQVEFSVVGGYGYPPQGPPRVSKFGPDGNLHMVSGDYAVLHILSSLDKPLFINVLCFDSAFGVTQLYPVVDEGVPQLTNEPKGHISELALHLRLALPVQRLIDPETKAATEVLKIFISDTPASFQPVQLPPIGDGKFLRENPDPASKLSSPSKFSSVNDNINSDSVKAFQEQGMHVEHGTIPSGLRPQLHEEGNGNWFCYTAKFKVHKTANTIE